MYANIEMAGAGAVRALETLPFSYEDSMGSLIILARDHIDRRQKMLDLAGYLVYPFQLWMCSHQI